MAEMEALKAELVSLKTGLMVELGEVIDARGFVLHEHNIDKILGAMNKHFEKMTIMAENSTRALNEASTLARREASHAVICDDDDIGNAFVTEIEDNLELSTFRSCSKEHHALKKDNNASSAALKKQEFLVGYHHNHLNPLPSNFVFPKMTPLQLITNRFLGDLTKKYTSILVT